jgi:very-short-patch-repair endonuclease
VPDQRHRPAGVQRHRGRALVDALWADERVVVEVDGHRGHASWAQIQRDRERDLALRAAGDLVLRYGWRQLLDDPHAVAADLSAALGARR